MLVLVCGGREFEDWGLVRATLDHIHAETMISEIIQGGAFGADALARQWATLRKIPWRQFDADWKKWGKSAGFVRNREMLAESPDLVVAFPGGAGTADMVKQAKNANVKTLEV